MVGHIRGFFQVPKRMFPFNPLVIMQGSPNDLTCFLNRTLSHCDETSLLKCKPNIRMKLRSSTHTSRHPLANHCKASQQTSSNPCKEKRAPPSPLLYCETPKPYMQILRMKMAHVRPPRTLDILVALVSK